MNRKILVSLLSLLLLLTASCHVYKEYDKESFPTYSWDDGQEISFNPKIEDISKSYQILFGLRHHYRFQSKSFNVKITIIFPSGWKGGLDDITKYAESWEMKSDFQGLKQFIMFRKCDAYDE